MTSTNSTFRLEGNPLYFVLFRIFFNCRFYYPILSILFVDFGLTLAQYSLLNVAWAISIVLFEVPSGALADVWGRKNLVRLASSIMLIEMAVFCLAPVGGNIDYLFPIFLLNRFLSGIAEAAASGADEALAYDTLETQGLADKWPNVLEILTKYQSLVMGVAMLLGSILYDHESLNQFFSNIGIGWNLDQSVAIKIPLFLTLAMAFGAFWSAWKMEEAPLPKHDSASKLLKQSFSQTLATGNWIYKTRFVFVVILAAFLFDSVIRMLMTLSSNLFRLIEIPEYLFGALGLGMSLTGLFVARGARWLTTKLSSIQNLFALFIWVLINLYLLQLAIPLWGVIPFLLLGMTMSVMNFLLSHYLNQATSSERRATVLSFKGLALNLAYAFIGILYAEMNADLKSWGTPPNNVNIEDWALGETLPYFPAYFAIGFVVLLAYIAIVRPKKNPQEVIPSDS